MHKSKVTKKCRAQAIQALRLAASSGYQNTVEVPFPDSHVLQLAESPEAGSLASKAYFATPIHVDGEDQVEGRDYSADFEEAAALLEDGWCPDGPESEVVQRHQWDQSWIDGQE